MGPIGAMKFKCRSSEDFEALEEQQSYVTLVNLEMAHLSDGRWFDRYAKFVVYLTVTHMA